jgi:hypothetical protein
MQTFIFVKLVLKHPTSPVGSHIEPQLSQLKVCVFRYIMTVQNTVRYLLNKFMQTFKFVKLALKHPTLPVGSHIEPQLSQLKLCVFRYILTAQSTVHYLLNKFMQNFTFVKLVLKHPEFLCSIKSSSSA